MGKSKKFVGQPILSQILSCVSTSLIKQSAKQHNSNRYYKRIPLRVHLVTLLYGVFSYCNGLREICEGMLACEGKLAHLGLDKAPPRSTLSDANNKRSYLVFETIYFKLLQQYHSFISDSRLFSDILRGVGRNPLDGSRKKGGLRSMPSWMRSVV